MVLLCPYEQGIIPGKEVLNSLETRLTSDAGSIRLIYCKNDHWEFPKRETDVVSRLGRRGSVKELGVAHDATPQLLPQFWRGGE